MDAGVAVQLRSDDVTFDAADAALLRAVAEEGSVLGASNALGRSRARALGRLEELEAVVGQLVERQRGGAGGGGSRLTPAARMLLARFDRLRATLSGTAGVAEAVLSGDVVEREGELGVVATDAGRVRALLAGTVGSTGADTTDRSGGRPDPGSRVQVSIRADAVTLHDPAEAPDGDLTSARNRFSGRVAGVHPGESVTRVTVDVGADDSLQALVTGESLDRLGLQPGVEVVASFKATATRGTAARR